LSIPLLFVACDNDFEAPSEEISDLFIVLSSGPSTLREAQVDNFFSFSDVSQGAMSREWTIPEDAFFLRGPIPNNLPKHDDFIVNPGETVSSDKTINILFKKGNSNTTIGYRAIFRVSCYI